MQQFPLIDLFIDLFEFALHVSGDKLTHLQEHFLTAYTALVMKLGRSEQQIRNTWNFLTYGAGEEWRRSVGPIM